MNELRAVLVILLLVFVGAVVVFVSPTPTGYVSASTSSAFKINSVLPFLDSVQVNWTIYKGAALDHYEIQYRQSRTLFWTKAAVIGKKTVRILSPESNCTDSLCTIVLKQYDSGNNKAGATRAYVVSGIDDIAHKTYDFRVVAFDSKGKALASTTSKSASKASAAVPLGMPYCNDECLPTWLI